METTADVFLTNSVSLTGFDKAESIILDGAFRKLTFQIRPFYCPTEKWRMFFKSEILGYMAEFSLSENGICYMTIENIKIALQEFKLFTSNVICAVEKTNRRLENECVTESVFIKNTGLEIKPDITKIMDAIKF